MKSFDPIPYQLSKNGKWIPAGTAFEGDQIMEVQFRKNEFETKEEAYEFFAQHYIKNGFTEIKSDPIK